MEKYHIIGLVFMGIFVIFTFLERDKLYDSKKGCYYVSDVDREYKYKLELRGVLPNDKKESKLVVYTDNNQLTFEDVLWLTFSEHSEENSDIYVEFKR